MLDPHLLGSDGRPDTDQRDTVPLGPVGRCPDRPVLTIGIADDSGSVTAPGGSDPVSGRYREMGLALRAVAKSCRCKRELAALVHFDTPHGDVGPQRLNKAGFIALRTGLRVPLGGIGTSDLLPALSKAQQLATAHPDHDVVALIFSDFEFTDPDPAAVLGALEEFPGQVFGCMLGRTGTDRITGVDRVVAVDAADPSGTVANVLLDVLTVHRPGGGSGGQMA